MLPPSPLPIRPFVLAIVALCVTLSPVNAQPADSGSVPALRDAPVRYDDDHIAAAEHRARRDALLDALPGDALALFFAAPVRNRQNDVDFEYRQDSDLLYLTGTHEPGSVLLLAPGGVNVDGDTVVEVLFVPPRDPSYEVWEGRRFGVARAEAVLGVQRAVPATRLEEVLAPILANANRGDGAREGGRMLYLLPRAAGIPADTELAEQLALLDARAALDAADTDFLRSYLDRARSIKSEDELALLQEAIDITGLALAEAMRSVEPGMAEYEVEALIEYVFKRNGAESPGFPSIVGSGENAVILHYTSNRRPLAADDMLVMDVGAEVRGYTADVTRSVPVDGTFSDAQRAIYSLVLRAQEAAIAATRAGADFRAPHRAALAVVAEGLMELGLIDDAGEVRRFFLHGTSHYLGLDVHDAGDYGALRPGQVITVEPGVYIAASADVPEAYWNIGVRIEDDVLVTDGAPVVMSRAIPKSIVAIEALMQEEGLGNEAAGTLAP